MFVDLIKKKELDIMSGQMGEFKRRNGNDKKESNRNSRTKKPNI